MNTSNVDRIVQACKPQQWFSIEELLLATGLALQPLKHAIYDCNANPLIVCRVDKINNAIRRFMLVRDQRAELDALHDPARWPVPSLVLKQRIQL